MLELLNPVDRNVHRWHLESGTRYSFMLMSDLHWDNPHCDRELLKAHLDRAKAEGIPVLLNGDTFCLMQGKFDPRRSKGNIRPEHNTPTYLDDVISDAVDWFSPYSDILAFAGYGNHETSILRNVETDPLQRFADLFNKTQGGSLQVGGYGGWLVFKFEHPTGGARGSFKLKYFHGSGGGGPVTRGVIQNQRFLAATDGADAIWMGHVHEMYAMVNTVERLDHNHAVQLRDVLQIRTPTYKDEYGDGYMDYHIERGRPPKPRGAYRLDLEYSFSRHRVEASCTAWR